MKDIIFYVIIIILIIVTFFESTYDYGPDRECNMYGYGNKDEEIPVLFDRIDWANKYPTRVNLYTRALFRSIFVVIIAFVVMTGVFPSPSQGIKGIFVAFVLTIGFDNFQIFHCDKFTNYNIERNLRLLREKMRVKRGEKRPENILEKGSVKDGSKYRNYVCEGEW